MSRHRVLKDLAYAPYKGKDCGAGGTWTPRLWGEYLPIVTETAEARTIAQPTRAHMVCGAVLDVDGGDCTLTITGGYNADGDTSLTLADAGDFVVLISIEVGTSFYWRILTAEGVNVAIEDLTVDSLTYSAMTGVSITEYAAGVVGTAAAPVNRRWSENGTIITELKIDLTGLTSKNTANDVIGLAAGGVAYIGRNVIANNGIIYKMELICLETPAGGDNDINIVANATATLEYDGAGGTAYGVDGGDQVAGQVVQDLVQGLTADHYFYLTAGTGDTAAAYTAGMFLCRWYGHALLA